MALRSPPVRLITNVVPLIATRARLVSPLLLELIARFVTVQSSLLPNVECFNTNRSFHGAFVLSPPTKDIPVWFSFRPQSAMYGR